MILYFLNSISVGLIVTGWQGYKDTPYENFEFRKYIRTYIVSFLLILPIYFLNRDFNWMLPLPIIFLVMLSLERLIGEIYKGLVRGKSHKEYIHLIKRLELSLNKPNQRRLVAGIALFGVILVYFLIVSIDIHIKININSYLLGGMLGFIGGSISAIGGATKDAQFEGFKLTKFVRSPIVGTIGGVLLSKHIEPSYLLYIIAMAGFERLSVELYKTFITKQVRGIHERVTKINKYWLHRRNIFFLQYLVGLLYFIYLLNL